MSGPAPAESANRPVRKITQQESNVSNYSGFGTDSDANSSSDDELDLSGAAGGGGVELVKTQPEHEPAGGLTVGSGGWSAGAKLAQLRPKAGCAVAPGVAMVLPSGEVVPAVCTRLGGRINCQLGTAFVSLRLRFAVELAEPNWEKVKAEPELKSPMCVIQSHTHT